MHGFNDSESSFAAWKTDQARKDIIRQFSDLCMQWHIFRPPSGFVQCLLKMIKASWRKRPTNQKNRSHLPVMDHWWNISVVFWKATFGRLPSHDLFSVVQIKVVTQLDICGGNLYKSFYTSTMETAFGGCGTWVIIYIVNSPHLHPPPPPPPLTPHPPHEHESVSNNQPDDRLLNPFFKAQINKKIKALHHWSLWGEFTGYWWIPCKKGQ